MSKNTKSQTLELTVKNMAVPYNQRRKAKYELMKTKGLIGKNELGKYFTWRNALPRQFRLDLPSDPSLITRGVYERARTTYNSYIGKDYHNLL